MLVLVIPKFASLQIKSLQTLISGDFGVEILDSFLENCQTVFQIDSSVPHSASLQWLTRLSLFVQDVCSSHRLIVLVAVISNFLILF